MANKEIAWYEEQAKWNSIRAMRAKSRHWADQYQQAADEYREKAKALSQVKRKNNG